MMWNRNLARRVSAIEAEVPEIRTLAAGADRDVADLGAKVDANTTLLEALRKTQVEHYQELKADIGTLRGEFTSLRGEFRSSRAEMRAGFAHIAQLLEGLARDSGHEDPGRAN
jgi:chromosome segregation ATPase